MNKYELELFLKKLVELDGSDLHISAGKEARARIQGKIVPFKGKKYTSEELNQLAKEILRNRFDELIENKQLDFNFKLNEEYRFRGNVFFQVDGPAFVFRKIPTKIPNIQELNLPKSLYKFLDMERGLVLVTGVTGSGKSTTLAAIINEINNIKNRHIITIEDPVEFVHLSKKSLVNQRSIGEDAIDYKSALKAALREDPDIILVGEMRDIETIEIALHAAETGHLVFSTLHTIDAKETINRIIGVFPPTEQERIRVVLGSVLEGVISQRLVPTIDGKRTAAIEILLKTPRIKQLISEKRETEIKDAIEEGKEIYGTQSFDQHLIDLIFTGKINEEIALDYSSNKSDFLLKLKKEKAKRTNVKEEDISSIFSLKKEENNKKEK